MIYRVEEASGKDWVRRLWRAAAVLMLLLATPLAAGPSSANEAAEALLARLTPEALQQTFPGAEELEVVEGGTPTLTVKIGGVVAGYIFSTMDVVNAGGYSGIPFDLIGGVTIDGDITGAYLLNHREPIIGKPVSADLLYEYIAGYGAVSLLGDFSTLRPDYVKGATVSARLMHKGFRTSAQLVIADRVEGAFNVTEPQLDRHRFTAYGLDELLEGGSIRGIQLSNGDVLKLFEKAGGGRGAGPDQRLEGGSDGTFVRLFTSLITPPSIGSNLFGDGQYRTIISRQEEDGLAIWIATGGPFKFVTNSHHRKESGYLFDRVKIVQGDLEIRFTREMYQWRMGGGRTLGYRDAMVFYLPPDSGLDPVQPWEVILMIPGRAADGSPLTINAPLAYQLPEHHMLLPPPEPLPAWMESWLEKQTDITVLAAMLVVVTMIFVFQDSLVRRPMLYRTMRTGFLAFTLGWLGWYAGGQLSIVNVMAYFQALFTHTDWSYFLLDPIIFIVSVYVALTLLVLGRGVFCGWLCPFGALQELLSKAAQFLKLPQVRIPRNAHERLWAIKYLVAAGTLGLVFVSVDMAGAAAEVEPFKTAINGYFMRAWPFTLYAVALLVVGLFVERFYCRFLCPLGGTLAVLGRIHMFRWLKRRPQCGTACRICEADCPIDAIAPSGNINMNECLQCMDCQVDYYDDGTCPPLIQRRKRREVRQAAVVTAAPVGPEAVSAE